MRDVRTAAHSILVADDDADILDVFVHVLGEAGYATTRAGSVEEVLASIDSETFDLVLTDPFATRASAGPDGRISRLGAVLTIQRHAMPTPVVVCTAWSYGLWVGGGRIAAWPDVFISNRI
jgi:CheY-like chemotaxis protein